MTCPQDLRRRYHEGRVIPFIGAGASMSLHWVVDGEQRRGPSWGEMVNQATTLLGFEDPDLARVRGTDLQILEYFKLKYGGQMAKLTNWLSRLMNPPDDALTGYPKRLAVRKILGSEGVAPEERTAGAWPCANAIPRT